MQGHSKGSVGPIMKVHNNGSLEASIQCYSMGGVGPFMST
jgi:hypothetical protein